MARKNLLASVTGHDAPSVSSESRSDYARRGASRSMMISIDEMAENSKKMVAGEAIVGLDPDLIDGSFVSDRLADDDDDYIALRDAIKEQGQSTPILVRPHPDHEGRYMIVFGHRRARVAKELGISVRAVIKNLAAIAHIVAQGQENTARANLSFIEKALFARKLLEMGQSKDTIKSALTVDDTLLSRLLSVADTVPPFVIEAFGAAKTIGRDRWEDLKKVIARPTATDRAREIVRSDEFRSTAPTDRFSFLLRQLKASRQGGRKPAGHSAPSTSWTPEDKLVAASFQVTGNTFSLSLKAKHASEFGQFISSNLDALYRAFKEAKYPSETGD